MIWSKRKILPSPIPSKINKSGVDGIRVKKTITYTFSPLLPIYFVSAENTIVQKAWFDVDWPRRNKPRLVQSEIATLRISKEGSNQASGIWLYFPTNAQRSGAYISNNYLQITVPTSIILYVIEIREKSSIEWYKELTHSNHSFRIADWR